MCCKSYSFVTVKVLIATIESSAVKMWRFFFLPSPSNYWTFCQVWGESTSCLHLPAACQITGCRQKYSYRRAHSQPHWGPQCLLTHMEGGESLCPCYITVICLDWRGGISVVLLHVSFLACRCHMCSLAMDLGWDMSISCTASRTCSWLSSPPQHSLTAQWFLNQPKPAPRPYH